MYVFLIYLLLTVYMFLIRNRVSRKYKKTEFFICLFLFFFFVIRYNIGRDLLSYNVSFYVFKEFPEKLLAIIPHRNGLYHLFLYICIHLFNDYRWVMFLINIFTLTICSITIYKNSKDLILSTLIFIGSGVLEVYYASGVRQMMAMSIFFFAFYQFLPKKKYGLYELFILIACLFHETVIIAAIIPLLTKGITLFHKYPVKMTTISSCIAISSSIVLSLLLPRLLTIEGVPWEYYTVIGYFSHFSPSILGIGMETTILIGVLFIYLQTERRDDDFLTLQYMTILLSVLVYYLFIGFSNVSRVSDSIQIILIVFLPNLISCIKNRTKQIISQITIIMFNAFLLFADMKTNLPAAGRELYRDLSILNDPYVTVFNTSWIDKSFEQREWYPYHRHLQ